MQERGADGGASEMEGRVEVQGAVVYLQHQDQAGSADGLVQAAAAQLEHLRHAQQLHCQRTHAPGQRAGRGQADIFSRAHLLLPSPSPSPLPSPPSLRLPCLFTFACAVKSGGTRLLRLLWLLLGGRTESI